jgi:predicted type IV restriction endonuclease
MRWLREMWVVEVSGSVVADPSPAPKSRAMPRWESDCRDRLKAAIPNLGATLAKFVARDANEAETRLLVTDLLEALGFDRFEDLTMEFQVKGEFADYGVRIDQQLVAFVEVKRVAQKLSERHLRQVQAYSLNEGVEWMMLTNGQVWQAYHVTAAQPVIVDLFLTVDLLDSQTSIEEKVDGLYFLTKEAFKRKLIDELWRQRTATSPKALASVILSEKVVDSVRLELRRRSAHNFTIDDLTDLVRSTVLRPEVLP